MTSVFLGCPWYVQCRPETAFCLVDTALWLHQNGIQPYMGGVFDCPVGHARSQLVAGFMASGATHLLMMDADMMWEPDAVGRLLRHDVPIVAVPGPDKRTGRFFVAVDGAPEQRGSIGKARYNSETGLLYVDKVGLCFTLIRRDAIELLMDEYPHLHVDSGNIAERLAPFYYGFFEQPCVDGKWLTEDFSFSHLCRKAGLPLAVDPWVEMSHVVPHVWRGRMIDQLQWADGEKPQDPYPT